jgi:tRNA G18 (ribose-2'-O)-methylase SpoU
MRKLKLHELNRSSVEEFKSSQKSPVVVVLDNIRSANNVGAFFRTSDAFKIDKIFLTGITASPPHKEITKSAIGATKSVDWEYMESVKECCLKLKEEGYIILGIEQTNSSVFLSDFDVDTNSKYALVFGNEVMGISDEILEDLDYSIEIQQYGTKHSLNVAVCGGITLHYITLNYHLH